MFDIHAAQTAHQTVEGELLVLKQDITPEVGTDPATASRFTRLHAGPGPLQLSYSATINILHHRAVPDALAEVPMRCLPLDVMPYVYPGRYCQSDRLLKTLQAIFREIGAVTP